MACVPCAQLAGRQPRQSSRRTWWQDVTRSFTGLSPLYRQERTRTVQYDIEADWYILEACDLGCYYCGIGPERTASELTVQASPLQWRQAFQATGKTWNLHLTGGEPGQYPGFVDLCE